MQAAAHAKVNEWHRLYNELGAAQQRLAVADRHAACDERARAKLQSQVTRLQRESESALQALRAAVQISEKRPR
jgi:hypothetical protein